MSPRAAFTIAGRAVAATWRLGAGIIEYLRVGHLADTHHAPAPEFPTDPEMAAGLTEPKVDGLDLNAWFATLDDLEQLRYYDARCWTS